MKISVLAVGKLRGPLEAAVREFEVRASRYWKLDVVEVESGSGRGARRDPSMVRSAEARRLLTRLPEKSEAWALTRQGVGTSSSALAQALGAKAVAGSPGVAFILGGAFGLDEEVLGRAQRKLSLSKMTLPHDMARLVLAEQLYRAGTILRKEPYHKGRE